MYTNIVLFKLKDRSPANITKTKNVVMSMAGKIDELRHLEVGENIKQSDRAYDLAVTVKTDSRTDYDVFAMHPAHREVSTYMRSVEEVSITVGYEV